MKAHRQNYLGLMEQKVAELVDEEGLLEAQAFTKLAAEWLGYDLDEPHFTDGKSDRGVDFWFGSETTFEFFQVKSHQLTAGGKLDVGRFGNEGVSDLRRICDLLAQEEPPSEASRKIQGLVREWNLAIAKRRLASEPEPVEAVLSLVVFGDGLTREAQSELSEFERNASWIVQSVPVTVRVRLLTLDDLVEARWRQLNRAWKDKSGKKRSTIDLQPEMIGGEANWIPGHHSAVFYCRAVDLITAFEDFGYQIFEPNVRAHIRRSKVNTAIRSSLAHRQTRKEFRFLNNGVTITCKGFQKPTHNRQNFRVTEPGVVNGLQTVVAMHQEYSELSQDEKRDLEDNCYVLVRLLMENAVSEIGRVVLATNTQNPMQARNLRSNNEEQVLYERLFAEMGWFYERKQGAWEGFKEDPARWRTLANYRKKHFASSGGRFRRVDNEELAQTWLSLLGFSDIAVHRKRELFEEDDFYRLVFLSRPKAHGSSYDFNLKSCVEEAEAQAPEPQLMLASYLIREVARYVPLGAREARESAITRLGLSRNQPRELIDAELAQDLEFTRSRALSGMSFLFCDFVGFVLFETFGAGAHYVGRALLKTPSLARSTASGSTGDVVAEIRKGDVEGGDVLPVLWFVFHHIIDELLAGPWRESFHAASVRSRFVYHKDTRTRIERSFRELEEYMQRSQLTKAWAADIPPGESVTKYVRTTLEGFGA